MIPTIISAGVATNVVPMHAEITIDMRNLPGDEGNAPLCFVRRAVEFAGLQVTSTFQSKQPCVWSPAIDVAWAFRTAWHRLFALWPKVCGSSTVNDSEKKRRRKKRK
jgi:acetylornithine deacetylase/succinyl-diaminopimelate desuccinylase-like protein